ncbi:MAG: hypothetical protein F6K41_24035 [Symploca sp. SIO3E6]|nr:hypothetical protein [Caldora sp. SIO3E6]
MTNFVFGMEFNLDPSYQVVEKFGLEDLGITPEEWNILSSDEQIEKIEEHCSSLIFENISWWWRDDT